MKKYVIVFILIAILISIYLRSEQQLKLSFQNQKYDLEKYGVCRFNDILDTTTVSGLLQDVKDENYKSVKNKLVNNQKIQKYISDTLGDKYNFQDYIWVIKKSSVHTCHRDNNGDFFNKGQKHPSYTVLVYLEDMHKCLSVIPESHLQKGSHGVNIVNNLQNVQCKRGDVIIFNANLIHVGTILEKENNIRIQMKITHKDDLQVLDYYENFNKLGDRQNPVHRSIRHLQRNLSCMFPILSDLSQDENIRTARGSKEVQIGLGQKIFSLIFYGDPNFYDLPDTN